MGFNKRIITLSNLLQRYQLNNNIEDVKQYLNADALLVKKDSSRIVDKINQGDDDAAILILKYELSRQNLS
jgi:hypothetical protein